MDATTRPATNWCCVENSCSSTTTVSASGTSLNTSLTLSALTSIKVTKSCLNMALTTAPLDSLPNKQSTTFGFGSIGMVGMDPLMNEDEIGRWISVGKI